MSRTSDIHDAIFARIKELGADCIRYLHWDPFPRISLPEPSAPSSAGRTSWRLDVPWTSPPDPWCMTAIPNATAQQCVTNTSIDDYVSDFMAASTGHDSVMNFSPLPAWMLHPPPPPLGSSSPGGAGAPPSPPLCTADCAMVPLNETNTFYLGTFTSPASPTAEKSLAACEAACLADKACAGLTFSKRPVAPCVIYTALTQQTGTAPATVGAVKCKAGSSLPAAQCGYFGPAPPRLRSPSLASPASRLGRSIPLGSRRANTFHGSSPGSPRESSQTSWALSTRAATTTLGATGRCSTKSTPAARCSARACTPPAPRRRTSPCASSIFILQTIPLPRASQASGLWL